MGADLGDRERDLALIRANWYDVPHYWPVVEQWIAAALEGRSITIIPDDVYYGCLTGTMTLWVVVKETPIACAVTEIVNNRRARICQLLIVGGKGLEDWIQFEAEIRAMAKQAGCDAIEAAGRLGWQKKAPDYEPVYMIYRRML